MAWVLRWGRTPPKDMFYTAAISRRNIIYSKSQASQDKSKKLIVYLLILLIISFSVLYIVQANNLATGGYRIQEYQNKLSALQSANKTVRLRLSEVSSPDFLEEKIKGLNMVEVGRVEYISPISEVAAK